MLLIVSATSSASVLFTDNFDAEHGGVTQANYNAFANWSVTDGTVDLIANGSFGLTGNGMFVDMDGSSANAGTMTTRSGFNIQPGYLYRLSFRLSGNRRSNQVDILHVSFGTAYAENFSDPYTTAWHTVSREFTAASSQTAFLAFAHDGGDNVGMMIDEVVLEVVPEPTSLIALGTASAALVRLRRIRA